jgi:hypothetical protein
MPSAQRGTALLVVLLLIFLVSAIVFSASTLVRVDLLIADRFRASAQALYAAESGISLALSELRREPTWSPVVSGLRQSPLSTGPFAGTTSVPGGGSIDLCCGNASVEGRLSAETSGSSFPARRAVVWRPFLWLPFDTIAKQMPPSRLYLVVFVAEDEEEAGGGSVESNGRILVRSEAVDPTGLRRSVEALIGRPSFPPGGKGGVPDVVEILSWREVR